MRASYVPAVHLDRVIRIGRLVRCRRVRRAFAGLRVMPHVSAARRRGIAISAAARLPVRSAERLAAGPAIGANTGRRHPHQRRRSCPSTRPTGRASPPSLPARSRRTTQALQHRRRQADPDRPPAHRPRRPRRGPDGSVLPRRHGVMTVCHRAGADALGMSATAPCAGGDINSAARLPPATGPPPGATRRAPMQVRGR